MESSAVTIPLYNSPNFSCNIILNDLVKAKEILLENDEYIVGLSEFDLHSKMFTSENVTKEDFKTFQAAAIIPWSESDITNWKQLIAKLAGVLKVYSRIPLPTVIYLNLTTGEEESGAAYTRGKHGIFLPRGMVNWENLHIRITRLLLHETWHIISRNLRLNNPQLRHDIYGIIGFKPLGHLLEYPPELTKISNPDAPLLEHYCSVTLNDGTTIHVLPIIHSKVKNFDPKTGQSFFQLMLRQMLFIKQLENGTWVPEKINDNLQLRNIDSMPESFWQQVGRNTSYLIHPEETVADNFSYIFVQPSPFPNPEIVEKFKTYLVD